MFGPEGSNVPSTRPRIHRDRGLLVQGLLAAGLGALCLLWPASAEWLRPIGSLAVLLGVVLLVVHVLVARHPARDASSTLPQAFGFDLPNASPAAEKTRKHAPPARPGRPDTR